MAALRGKLGLFVSAFLCLVTWFAHAENIVIRSTANSCRLALVSGGNLKGISTTRGDALTVSLDPDHIREALQSKKWKIDTERDRLFVIGASMDSQVAAAKVEEIRTILREEGYDPKVSIESIRKIASFIDAQVGLFVHMDNGSLQKIATLDPLEIRRAILTTDPELLKKPLLLVGAPAFGGSRARYEKMMSDVQEKRGDSSDGEQPVSLRIDQQSNLVTYAKAVVSDPIGALKSLGQRIRWNLPMRQDLQTPDATESGNGLMKVAVTGVITTSVMALLGQPLHILFPVAMVNAALSTMTGVFRISIGNWMTRSEHYFPERFLRQVAFTTVMTGALHVTYELATGQSLGHTLGPVGWREFAITNGLTTVMQTMWRIPKTWSLISWKNLRDRQNTAVGAARTDREKEIRQMASSVEKMDSYVMLLPYLMVISDHVHNLFSHHFEGGDFRVSPWHLMMAVASVWAFRNIARPNLIDGVSKGTLWFDRQEARVLSPATKAVKKFIMAPAVQFFQSYVMGKKPVPAGQALPPEDFTLEGAIDVNDASQDQTLANPDSPDQRALGEDGDQKK